MGGRNRAGSETSNESKQSTDSSERTDANSSANAAHDVFGGTPAFAEPMETHSAFGEASFDPEPLWGAEDDTPPHRDFEIQRALEGTDTTEGEVPEVVLDVLGSGGQALEGPIQRALEERMDADFSSVRVHTGSQAAQAAESIDAKAFTCGNDVVFNSGEYNPETSEGQYLLAHELAHVRQQTGAAISMMPQEGAELGIDPDPRLEREADETAKEALSGDEPLVVSRMGTDVHIQRVGGIMPVLPGGGLFGKNEEEQTDDSIPADPEVLAAEVEQLKRNQEHVMKTLEKARPGAPSKPGAGGWLETAVKGLGGALAGAGVGAAVGTAVGGPVGTLVGAGVGAISGMASDLTKQGIDYAADRLPGSQAKEMQQMYREMAEMYKELKEGSAHGGTSTGDAKSRN